MVQPRFLILAFPLQSTINPSLTFADRLIRVAGGAQVTFVTGVHAHRSLMTTRAAARGSSSATPDDSLSIVMFSDGYDDGCTDEKGINDHFAEFRRRGWQAVADILESGLNKEGRPYTCLVYTMLLSWATEVAAAHNVPATILWIQPATVFDIYYYYFHGHREIIRENSENPSFSLSFPGIPLAMSLKDLPLFMADSKYSYFVTLFQDMCEDLENEGNNTKIILVNTFDELEPEALRAIGNNNKFDLIGIGPLISSTFLEENKDACGCGSDYYIDWLNTKPKTTVVYVSFGSISVLSKQQMEEMARGLLEFGRPFLWVIRENSDLDEKGDDDDELSCREELEKLGMIVPRCSQMEVLSNESVGCFVTHCGWNSTLESLASGVPMVAFPQWTDQGTNPKPNKDEIVRNEEIKRCLDLIMGRKENGMEIVSDFVKKWQNLAKEAVREGGSSEKNFMTFVNRFTNKI
ncbi:phloretin 4'-O-glucosyltransferase-like [Humulus lupulus]|uniref:phloretin 4'-O-glucosyltransferase-like n=1 Tax=Humulus lupulus TaxID=3486 RepID=UPI002B407A69|nr:phloretin 4'-O-glucosyltransferase-like [Humulus lupulus]